MNSLIVGAIYRYRVHLKGRPIFQKCDGWSVIQIEENDLLLYLGQITKIAAAVKLSQSQFIHTRNNTATLCMSHHDIEYFERII